MCSQPLVHRRPSMVEPAKARGLGWPRKTEAQKAASAATQAGVQSVVVQPSMTAATDRNSKSEFTMKNGSHGTMSKDNEQPPLSWVSIVNGSSDYDSLGQPSTVVRTPTQPPNQEIPIPAFEPEGDNGGQKQCSTLSQSTHFVAIQLVTYKEPKPLVSHRCLGE